MNISPVNSRRTKPILRARSSSDQREAKTAIGDYDVYYWETTYSSPSEPDEFYVGVDPVDGDVVYLYHYLPDDAPGANLSHAAAQQRAEQFLAA